MTTATQGMRQVIRIIIKGFDPRSVDDAARSIVDTAIRTGAVVSGPVLLPIVISRFTVNRSPHVDKKSMDAFEMREHKRLIDILYSSGLTVEELRKLNLPSGVDIDIRLLNLSVPAK